MCGGVDARPAAEKRAAQRFVRDDRFGFFIGAEAELARHRGVKAFDAQPPQRHVEHGDVAEADDPFGLFAQRREVEQREQAHRSVAALIADDGFHAGIVDHGLQPPARQCTQHRKAAILVFAAGTLHRAQHEVPGREHRRGKAQRLEVICKVGGLSFARGHDAEHPVQVLLQSGIQQGPACRGQTEQRCRAGLCKAGRDLLVFLGRFQQGFVHGKPPFLLG